MRYVARGFALVSLLVLVAAGPVHAGGIDATGSTTTGDSASVELEGVVPGSFFTSPAVPDWVLACNWDVWTTEEVLSYFGQFQDFVLQPDVAGGDPDERWSVVYCGTSVDTGGAVPTGVLRAWRIGERPPQAVLDWLVAYAYASVQIPAQVGWSAPFGDDQAPMITQLPTWLWVEPEVWAPQSATTPPVFGITATVTVTPLNVTFEGADGQVVDCGANLAPVYDFSRAEEDQHSDCTLTYHHSSAVGEWHLTSTVTWGVTYICSAYCGPGTLPSLTATSTRPVQVAELQAVLVNPDG